MKQLIKILQVAVKKHGKDRPLTIGHLLLIAEIAEDSRKHEQEVAAIREQKEHAKILEWASPFGQD